MVPIVFPFIKNPVKYRNYFRKSEMVTATFEIWFRLFYIDKDMYYTNRYLRIMLD